MSEVKEKCSCWHCIGVLLSHNVKGNPNKQRDLSLCTENEILMVIIRYKWERCWLSSCEGCLLPSKTSMVPEKNHPSRFSPHWDPPFRHSHVRSQPGPQFSPQSAFCTSLQNSLFFSGKQHHLALAGGAERAQVRKTRCIWIICQNQRPALDLWQGNEKSHSYINSAEL